MRILIADDHGIVRGGMKLLIERQPDMEVVAEAGDGVEAFEKALQTKPDLCVMDVSMPRMTGLQAARQIRAHLPETQVLALSMHDDERYVFDALKAGASGYVLKREVDQALLNAIRAVSRGDAFLTNAVERTIVREWMSDSSGPRSPSPARAGGPQADRRGLHEQADRRDPAPRREDRRVAPREPAAQARHARPRGARALRDPPRPHRGVTFPRARRRARHPDRGGRPRRGGRRRPAVPRSRQRRLRRPALHAELPLRDGGAAADVRGNAAIDAIATQELSRLNLDYSGDAVAASRRRRPGAPPPPRPGADRHARARRSPRARASSCGSPTGRARPATGAWTGAWFATPSGSATAPQPNGAHRIFPSNDHPSDLATYTIKANTPAGVDASSRTASGSGGAPAAAARAGSTRCASRWPRS